MPASFLALYDGGAGVPTGLAPRNLAPKSRYTGKRYLGNRRKTHSSAQAGWPHNVGATMRLDLSGSGTYILTRNP